MKHGSVIMPFGKHKGKPMSDVPIGYCDWLWDNCDLRPSLRAAVAEKLGIKEEPKEKPKINVNHWFRALAIEFHPDRTGGSHVPMQVLERAREKLLEQMNGR